MNILLLAALLIIEIGLAVFSTTEQKEKQLWYRNRFIANCIEELVFFLFAIFKAVDFSFKYKGLFILLTTRVIVSLIIFLCKRKAEGALKTGKAVASAILSLLLIIPAMLPSFIIKEYKGLPVSGSYEVATASAIFVDHERIEEFETDGSFREVPVEIYYPKTEDDKENFPVIFASHGAFGYNKSNYSTYTELASNGYVVVSMNHPYHAFFCKDTSGKTITVDLKFFNDVFAINSGNLTEREILEISSKWLELRSADMNFAIDTFKECKNNSSIIDSVYVDAKEKESFEAAYSHANLEKIGLMGHSLGGATAVSLGRERNDIGAVVNLDATLLSETIEIIDCEPFEFEGRIYTEKHVVDETPYVVPLLNIDNDEHHNSRVVAKEIGMPYTNNVVMENTVEGYDTYLKGAGHMNLTDLPLISPFLASKLGTGDVDAKECISTINSLVLSFYNCELKNQGSFTIEECYGN